MKKMTRSWQQRSERSWTALIMQTFEELQIEYAACQENMTSDNAILKLNAGAGGTESCDWCSMLVSYVYQMGRA